MNGGPNFDGFDVVDDDGLLYGATMGVATGEWSKGQASTLMSTVPVLLIPVSALLFREVVSPSEIAGAVLAVVGVAVLAW
jgi:drug/metabolite transporter (DMT)-like permease